MEQTMMIRWVRDANGERVLQVKYSGTQMWICVPEIAFSSLPIEEQREIVRYSPNSSSYVPADGLRWMDFEGILRDIIPETPTVHLPGCWKLQSPSGRGECNCGAALSTAPV